jgi:hypothetical protein
MASDPVVSPKAARPVSAAEGAQPRTSTAMRMILTARKVATASEVSSPLVPPPATSRT